MAFKLDLAPKTTLKTIFDIFWQLSENFDFFDFVLGSFRNVLVMFLAVNKVPSSLYCLRICLTIIGYIWYHLGMIFWKCPICSKIRSPTLFIYSTVLSLCRSFLEFLDVIGVSRQNSWPPRPAPSSTRSSSYSPHAKGTCYHVRTAPAC